MGIGPFEVERAQAVAVVLLALFAMLTAGLAVLTALLRWRYASLLVALTFGLCAWAGAKAWLRGEHAKANGDSLAGRPDQQSSLPIDVEHARLGAYVSARMPVDYGFRWVLLPLGVGAIAALLLVRNRIPAWGWALVFITAIPATIVAEVNRRARAAPLPSSKYTFWDDGESVVLQRSIEDVERVGHRSCLRLETALRPFWQAEQPDEWPRRFRRLPHADVGDWKSASQRCVASFLATRDIKHTPISAGLSLPSLLQSPLLQDDAQRTELQKRAQSQ